MYVRIYIILYIYIERERERQRERDMVFTNEGLFEVATESWPGWDLNPRPLNSALTD